MPAPAAVVSAARLTRLRLRHALPTAAEAPGRAAPIVRALPRALAGRTAEVGRTARRTRIPDPARRADAEAPHRVAALTSPRARDVAAIAVDAVPAQAVRIQAACLAIREPELVERRAAENGLARDVRDF